MKLKQKLVKNNQELLKIFITKKVYFSLCTYKMSQISKEAYKKCEVEIIDKGRYFWINRRDLEVESDNDNWAQIFNKCDPNKQKQRYELTPNAKFQPSRKFVQNDLVERKIKSCRNVSEEFLKLEEKLGLDPYEIACGE